MKDCSYCGATNEDSAVHCRGCGQNEFRIAPAKKSPPPEPKPRSPVTARALTAEEQAQAVVTLCSCRTLEEADAMVSRLKSFGIEALLPDEFLQQAVAWNLNTYGYVRVQVPTAQYPQAAEALQLDPLDAGESSDAGARLDPLGDDPTRLARAAEPLPLSMKCLLLFLPGTCAGLIFAALIRTSYLRKGYQRRADSVWNYVALGLAFWAIVYLSLALAALR